MKSATYTRRIKNSREIVGVSTVTFGSKNEPTPAAHARARAITWMFAALNTVEAPILDLQTAKFIERDKTWYEERLPLVEGRIHARLGELSTRLGEADWLDGEFSAGDLMMISVLLRLKSSGMLDQYPNLAAYIARGEGRPAYQRAFAAQLAVFNRSSSTG